MVDQSRKPPRGSLIHATARYERSFEMCLYELIDNCINAGARWISITCSTKKGDSYLRIEDDGCGCENLDAMIVLGERIETPDNANGYWGIGGTEACIIIGGAASTCQIASVHGGRRRSVSVRWREVADSDWGYPSADEEEAERGTFGTSITIQPLNKTPKSWDALGKLIAERYWPALTRRVSPVSIFLKTPRDKSRQQIGAPEFPKLLPGAIDDVVRFGNYEAHVRCGIVPPETKNTVPGFTYFMFPRVIRQGVSEGAGDHSVAQIFGQVELVKGWSKGGLSAFKQEFDAADRLYEEVERLCQDVLRKADELGENVEIARFNRDVTDLLGDMLGQPKQTNPGRDAKAQRDSGDGHGPVKPTGDGAPHTQAEKEQPGTTFPGRDGGGGKNARLKVTHRALGGTGAGSVTEREIILNTDRALIAAALKERDTRLSAVIALALWNEFRAFNPRRAKRKPSATMPLDFNDPQSAKILSERFGQLLDGYSKTQAAEQTVTAAE